MTAVRELLPSSSTETSGKLDYVQGLRALAIVLVVAFHAGLPVPGGYIGVDIFFVISGFVISGTLIREINRSGRVNLSRFYRRRIARLVPAIAVVLASTAIASAILQSPMGSQQDTAVAGIGAATWTANGVFYLITGGYFDAAAESQPLLHTWSLSVEEQFYLVFPGLIAIASLVAKRRDYHALRVLWWVVCILASVSFALNVWMAFEASGSSLVRPVAAAFYMSPTRAWEFAAGVIIALIAARGLRNFRFKAAAGWVGCACVGIATITFGGLQPYPGVSALLPVVGTCALILAGTDGAKNIVTHALSNPIARWIGDISYSLYLWHWPLIIFAGILWPGSFAASLGAASMAVPLAWLSYTLVERPFRNYTRRYDRLRWKVTVPLFVVPVLLSVVLYQAASAAWWKPSLQSMAAQVRPDPIGYKSGCHSTVPIQKRNRQPCTYDFGGKQETWLVGDSNAAQYAEAVINAERTLHGKAMLATANGCPLVDIVVLTGGSPGTGCDEYVRTTLNWFDTRPPSKVLLGAANEAISDPNVVLKDRETGKSASDIEAKSSMWSEGLDRVLRRLKSAGHQVIMIGTIPHLQASREGWWNPSTCALFAMAKSVANCGLSVDLASENHRQRFALLSEGTAALTNDVELVSLRGQVCVNGMCEAERDGYWVYRDGLHISTAESRKLAPSFIQALRR